jgi:lipopolysaccharide/colanic/teichoic acid biosynthesis glycosyltransferase
MIFMGVFPQTSSLPRPLTVALPFAPTRVVPAAVRNPSAMARPIGETLFLDALARERARSDRFEEPFVVARLTRADHKAVTARWDRVVDALSTVALPSDLIGWLETGTVLAVIRPAVSSASAAEAMRCELAKSLPSDRAGCSVTVDTYDPRQDVLPEWLVADLSRQRSATDIGRAAAKRLLDVAGSIVMLALLAPLMVMVALLIRFTSPGPVLFRQERVGAGGRPFRIIKFRTIRADADATVHQQYVEHFIAAGARMPEGAEAVCKMVNDPRVTLVGRFLRRSSLDEVPQFWNVLVGEMSLVGPRPPLPYEVARYKTWHRRRVFEATPGMTGLWQVSGRSRTSFDAMVRLDLRYVRNRTILNDLRILLATPRAVLSGRGAY